MKRRALSNAELIQHNLRRDVESERDEQHSGG